MRDNPAQRLHDILRTLKDEQQSRSIKTTLCEHFDVDQEETAKLLAVASALAALPDELAGALYDLHADEGPDELFMEWFPRVQQSVRELTQMSNNLQHFTQQYDEADLRSLRHIAFDFRQRSRDVPDADLQAVRDAMSVLAHTLSDSDVPEDLRRFLLIRVQEMNDALRLYPLQGAAALRRAVNTAIGATITRHVEGRDVPDQTSKAGRAYFDMIMKANNVASFGQNALELGSKIIQALGGG